MIDIGNGPPLVLIPGLHGRGDFMLSTIQVLARELRVISMSLDGDDGHADAIPSFDAQIDQLDDTLRTLGVERAVLAGVSYGGWIALQFAARFPDRVAGLALISSPPPGFIPSPAQQRYLRRPRLLAPVFVLTSPLRLGPEILAAIPTWSERVRFSVRSLQAIARSGMSPARMAHRMHVADGIDFAAICRQVRVPTLIVIGEPGLDRVVSVEQTRRYEQLIAGAKVVTLARTGHIGWATRPEEFTKTLSPFVRSAHERAARLDAEHARERAPRSGTA